MRIALLDDDDAQIIQLVGALKAPFVAAEGETICSTFSSGESLRRSLRTETFDVLVLDWMMPDLDGFDLLHWLRTERNDNTPVIMLSARAAERDVAAALTLGADDYIFKPFRPLELRARISRLFERTLKSRVGSGSRFGRWNFDSATNIVRYRSDDGEKIDEVRLTEKEFKFALTLFRNLDRPVSRGHLLASAGYNSESITRSLDIHIYRLRNKLQLEGTRDVHLRTVYGQGYRLQRSMAAANPLISGR
jgi:DNA-binding response OmpR family regulator